MFDSAENHMQVQPRLGTLRLARPSAFEEDAYLTCPVNATPSPTPSAADAVTGHSIVNTKVRDCSPLGRVFVVLNVGIL